MAAGLTSLFGGAYEGRRVLLTGHTGFKGAWLAAWLKALGARVAGYALPPEHGDHSLYQAARVGDDLASEFADIRDLAAVTDAFRRHRPEVVFHLAAQALVRRSYRDPVESYGTNVMGTVHVLEAARRTPSVRAVVAVTSDKCYGDQGLDRGYRETDRMGGDDPYSSSKGCAELVVTAYRRSFLGGAGVQVASARAGNVIGGGDLGAERLVPDIVRAVVAGEAVVVRNPEAVRPWQHVLDPLSGYLMLGARLLDGGSAVAQAWNFGPDDEGAVTVRELVERVSARWPRVRVAPEESRTGPPESRYLRLDADQARTRLGWTPQLGLDEAVNWTVDWYRRVLDDPGAAPAAVAEQLDRYGERLTKLPVAATPASGEP